MESLCGTPSLSFSTCHVAVWVAGDAFGHRYTSHAEWAAEVRLVCDNCEAYNHRDSGIVRQARYAGRTGCL